MGRKLYIGNLPYNVTTEELRALCEGGTRQVEDLHIPMDRESGRPRGFGFVEFATDEQAEEAIQVLNGHELSGRALKVNEARPREEGGGGGGGGGRGGRGGGGGGGGRGGRGGGGGGGGGDRW